MTVQVFKRATGAGRRKAGKNKTGPRATAAERLMQKRG